MSPTTTRFNLSFTSFPWRSSVSLRTVVQPVTPSPGLDRFKRSFTGLDPVKPPTMADAPMRAIPKHFVDEFI